MSDTIPHDVPEKQCSSCDKSLPITKDYFGIDNHTPGGFRSECRNCRSERYKTRYAERLHQYNLIYGEAHREEHREYDREYWIQNKEQKSQYYRDNAETHRGRARNYRIRKNAAPGSYTKQDIQRKYKSQGGKCYYCGVLFPTGKRAYQIDHVVPLTRGGSNDPSNIVLCCEFCNKSKANKLLCEWDGYKRSL